MRFLEGLSGLVFLFGIKPAIPQLSCSGGYLDRKGIFCHEERRDTEALLESLLQTDLSTEALIASRPQPVVRVVVHVAAPQPPPPPPPPPPPTTTTTTTPPMRRRTVPSGLAVCEDVNPLDSLDSDCSATRYERLSGPMFERLSEISQSKSLASTYVEKLEPIIPQVVPPLVQTDLGVAINSAVRTLQQAVDGALGDSTNAITNAVVEAADMAGGIERTFSNSTNVMMKHLGSNFDSELAVDQLNINQLIGQANKLNLASTVPGVVQSVQDLVSNGTVTLGSHVDFVNQMGSGISRLVDNLTHAIFYMTTNLTAQVIPVLQSATNNGTAARTNWLTTNGTQAVNKIVAQYDPAVNGILNETLVALDTTIKNIGIRYKEIVGKKFAAGSATTTNLGNSITGIKSDLGSTLANVTSEIENVGNRLLGGLRAKIESVINASIFLAKELPGVHSPVIDKWNFGAMSTLSELQTKLTNASTFLSQSANSGAGKTDAIMKQVLDSMAAIGSLQQNLTHELLQSHSAGLKKVRDLLNSLTSNGISFAKLVTGIKGTISAMSLTPTDVASPVESSLAYLTDSLTLLADRVNRLSVRLYSELSQTVQAVNDVTLDFASGVPADWSSFSKPLIETEDAAVTAGIYDIEQATRKWEALNSIKTTESRNAMSFDASVLNQLPSVMSGVESQVSQVRSQISNIESFFAVNLSSYSEALLAQQRMIDSKYLDSVRADSGQSTQYMNSVAKRALTHWNDTIADSTREMQTGQQSLTNAAQGSQLQHASELNSTVSLKNLSSQTDVNGMRDGVASAFNQFIRSAEISFDSANQSQIIPVQASIHSTILDLINDLSAMQQIQQINNRIEAAQSALASAVASMQSLEQSVQTVNQTLASGDNSMANLAVLIKAGLSVNQLLFNETNVLNASVHASESNELASLSDLSNREMNDINGFSINSTSWTPPLMRNWSDNVNILNQTLTSIVGGRTPLVLPRVDLVDANNSVTNRVKELQSMRGGIGETINVATLDGILNALEAALVTDSSAGENASQYLSKVTHDIRSFVEETKNNISNSIAVISALSGGSQSGDGARLIGSSTGRSLAELLSSIKAMGNAQKLVSDTQRQEETLRYNSVENLQASVSSASDRINSILHTALVKAVSNNSDSLGSVAHANRSLSQIVPIVSSEMNLLGRTYQSLVSSLIDSSEESESRQVFTLGKLSDLISFGEVALSTGAAHILNQLNIWNSTLGGNETQSRSELLFETSSLQGILEAFNKEKSNLNSSSLSDPISALAVESKNGTSIASVFEVDEAVRNVNRMIVTAGGA